MAGEVIFSQFTLAGTQDTVFNPDLVDIVDETTVSRQEQEAAETISSMGYYRQDAVNPNMQISSKVWARELSELTEGQVLPLIDVGKWPNKGVQVKPYWGKMEISKLVYDWAQSSRSLQGADPSVQGAIADFVDGMKDLRKGAVMDQAIEATLVLTKGFSVSATYWPGSATPDGNSLFDTDHPYKNSTETFRNVLGGDFGTLNDQLTADTNGQGALQNAIDILKYHTRTQRGHKITKPEGGIYDLIIPVELEVNVGTILNTAGTSAGIYAGTGSNAALLNTFYFQWNKVRFRSNSWFGYDSYEKGAIGSATNWFVVNSSAMRDQRALRMIVLNAGEAEMWYDPDTKQRYASYYHACAFDHFGAQAFVVGSLWTA